MRRKVSCGMLLWDTGANKSCVTASVIEQLEVSFCKEILYCYKDASSVAGHTKRGAGHDLQ